MKLVLEKLEAGTVCSERRKKGGEASGCHGSSLAGGRDRWQVVTQDGVAREEGRRSVV